MKTVNDLVNKRWANAAKNILTGNSPDISSLFTKLITITREEQQSLKSDAARKRFEDAYTAVADAVKYGWAFGISERQARINRPARFEKSRRVRALIPLGIEAGQAIGKAQLAKINRAHGVPKPGSISHRAETKQLSCASSPAPQS